MASKRSDRNKKKTADVPSQTGSEKKLADMPIKERKQVIAKNVFDMKTKFISTLAQVEEAVKDSYKQSLNVLQNELVACEDVVEARDQEIRKLKELLKKNKIKVE